MYVSSAFSSIIFVTRTQEEVVIVGRITHDPETVAKSKLIEGAIFIESSRMLSGGARVPLRFDPTMKIRGGVKGSGGFGLFPGKVAAFKGKNGGGGYFLATEYLSVSYFNLTPTVTHEPEPDPASQSLPHSSWYHQPKARSLQLHRIQPQCLLHVGHTRETQISVTNHGEAYLTK
jgi:hypothetical protein